MVLLLWSSLLPYICRKLEKIVGDKGDIETEVERLLVVHNVDTSDLNKQVNISIKIFLFYSTIPGCHQTTEKRLF